MNTSRIQSMSAPGNLNLDPSQVRFESPESNGQLENEWIDGYKLSLKLEILYVYL